MSPNPQAALADAQTPTGCVVLVADMTSHRLLLRLAGRRLDAVRIHPGLRDTP
jgi:hypothetical protein